MRLIKMFTLTALAAVATMAFVGVTSASAFGSTQQCKVNTSLLCPAGEARTAIHEVLATGTVARLLALLNILCLGMLVESTALGLANPQSIHALSMSFTGCGTGSAHDNCTVTVQELPLSNLLKTGVDEGVQTHTNGRKRWVCSGGIDCVFDTEGFETAVGAQHRTAEETEATELGGKFFCPNQGKLDYLLVTLDPTYVTS